MKRFYLFVFLLSSLIALTLSVFCQSCPDAASMQALKANLGNLKSLNWTDPNPCKWNHVKCSDDNRVTHIQIGGKGLTGRLPPDLRNLSSLILINVSANFLSGPIPSLAGLSSLQEVSLNYNLFSSFPTDFFVGLTSLQYINLDYNGFSFWEIPQSLKDAKELHTFSANVANISGTIPEFLAGDPPKLRHLHLSENYLEGPIPLSFGKSSIQTLWLGPQWSDSKLNGSLAVLQNMTSITELWLNGNHFTGPLPDISRLTNLEYLTLRANQLTGIVPSSLVNLPKLTTISLAFNFFQGPTPKFDESIVEVDKAPESTNSFCLDDPGVACDGRVNILLSIAKSMDYPQVFAQNWTGNNPCDSSPAWNGISCNEEGNIIVVNFQNLWLPGTISPDFSMLRSVEQLILSNNSLTGTIPNELTSLPNLTMLDLSNNNLYAKVPKFGQNVTVNIYGNPGIEKDSSFPFPGVPPHGSTVDIHTGGREKNSNTGIVLGSAFAGAVFGLFIVGLGLYFYKKKRKNAHRIHRLTTVVINPREARTSDIPADAFGNMVISIQVLREVTNNFSVQNILGRGGFGTVYKGELLEGRNIAVKRMETIQISSERGLKQFKSEIAVLTKVRHRHLVALLGYCLDGNERLLVYEFMSQGTLSHHLFNWKEEGLTPLDWSRRLIIALDVARGVEYLHGLAHESFIHRDLKPSNILLGDDMRAKVADFGLVRLAPEYGKNSTETRIAGTFGYLAPEYLVTGRVTTKVDVFSFGVILMELITGRRVVDETHSDPENVYLVTWFRSMLVNQETFRITIDDLIELDEETLASVRTVAELADQCCSCQPHQRPDMGRVVNVLSSLADLRKPITDCCNPI